MQMYTPSLCIVGKENIIKIDYKLNKADIILDILEQPEEMSFPRSRHMNRVFTHTAKKSNDTSQVSFRHKTIHEVILSLLHTKPFSMRLNKTYNCNII